MASNFEAIFLSFDCDSDLFLLVFCIEVASIFLSAALSICMLSFHLGLLNTATAARQNSTNKGTEMSIHEFWKVRETAGHLAISKSTLYGKLNKNSSQYDPSFPKPVRFGTASVRFNSTEISEWAMARMSERTGVQA